LFFSFLAVILAKEANVIGEIHMTETPSPKDVTWEHDAIRKQIIFLTKSLDSLAAKSDQGIMKINQLKEQITLYRWPLYDFREAVKRHMDVDEHVFRDYQGTAPLEDLDKEHEVIRKQLDKAITLAEKAGYSSLSEEELRKWGSDIKKTVDKVCKLIRAHTAKEDKILEQS